MTKKPVVYMALTIQPKWLACQASAVDKLVGSRAFNSACYIVRKKSFNLSSQTCSHPFAIQVVVVSTFSQVPPKFQSEPALRRVTTITVSASRVRILGPKYCVIS